MDNLVLLPQPRELRRTEGIYNLVDGSLILVDTPDAQETLFTAVRWQNALVQRTNIHWEITTSMAVPIEKVGILLRVDENCHPVRQGYKLEINPNLIQIVSGDDAGLFYGVCTLIQILSLSNSKFALPCLQIHDHPDYSTRGVMLDISRDKVPTLHTVCELVDRLASWKINQLQLYTEHTFAYRRHPEVWSEASPFTGEEILCLDSYCRRRFIELVPNQNSFGHMHRWLKHPQYRPLAECPNGCDLPWGGHSDVPFSLCPLDLGSIQLIRELYDELLPHFSSRLFNVGCDEIWDIGLGRSSEQCAVNGTGRVYLDFLLKVYKEVDARGRRMQFWGDIILQHPELVSELPKDIIALEWGYEANQPFNDHCEKFSQAGLDFYVCPGTSSWNSIAGRTDNALGNLMSAAANGFKHGAIGYLNTDWGDNGHWQPLPVSYLGFLAGAAYSWSFETNREINISQALSCYAFEDPTGNLGSVAYKLGNIYRACGLEPGNASALFGALQSSITHVKKYKEQITSSNVERTLEQIESAISPMSFAMSVSSDAELVKREFQFVAHTLKHACNRILFAYGDYDDPSSVLTADIEEIIQEYESIWLARNRPGGLADSMSRFYQIKDDYCV